MIGDRIWKEEHRVGIAKDVDARVVEELRGIFLEESAEVGIYLAMSRAADREGYPEVADAFRRIAYEEAEHAAKFAELLGDMVFASTQDNLSGRIDAEFMATSRKREVAMLAKRLNYDAIYSTVHEMARDESRHGRVFEGLLNRFFK